MRRILIISVVIMISGLIGNQIMAQNIKFGHINRNELIQLMPEFDSARSQLEKLNTELTNQLELLQVEYNNKAEAYIKESKNLSDLVRQTKEQELQDFQNRMQVFQQNASNQLQEKQVALFTPITEKADKAIKAVGKESSFFYIFDLSGGHVAYFDETKSVDVLPLVKSKLGLK
ncbi:MAG TPA: OmpH family outer membrane protein [Bacteroidales bacterium]|nr:OmpH family outer membrane protein [Bacteroidales bacterium]HNR43192.1 OmpH family outer membrane protein [Bacteroidales bacterium]HPM18317.1 OmpH family outer membrane protein [Bacteroidales bacterium]